MQQLRLVHSARQAAGAGPHKVKSQAGLPGCSSRVGACTRPDCGQLKCKQHRGALAARVVLQAVETAGARVAHGGDGLGGNRTCACTCNLSRRPCVWSAIPRQHEQLLSTPPLMKDEARGRDNVRRRDDMQGANPVGTGEIVFAEAACGQGWHIHMCRKAQAYTGGCVQLASPTSPACAGQPVHDGRSC